jgi:tetratricopeptide (TPR) repeat protein
LEGDAMNVITMRLSLVIQLITLATFWLSLTAKAEVIRDYYNYSDDPAAEGKLILIDGAHTNKAFRDIQEGRISIAIADLKFVLDRWPNHPRALMLIEMVATLTKVYSLAIPYYENAIHNFPQYAVTHVQYGKYLVDIGNLDAGIKELKRAIEIDSNLKPAYVWLAEGYYKKGDREQARLAIKKAKALGYTGEFPGDLQSSSAR